MPTEVKQGDAPAPAKKGGVVPPDTNDSLHPADEEAREETTVAKRDEDVEERDGHTSSAVHSKKRDPTVRSKSNNSKRNVVPGNSNNNTSNSKMQYPGMPGATRAPFPPMIPPGAGPPYAPPHPYAYPGATYRPPPPHYHHHHHHMPMPPYSGGPYPAHPAAMKGNYPPPPPYGPPYVMPPSYPHHAGPMHPVYHGMPSSDSASISSMSSKNTHKKKRTIEGVHSSSLPPAYSFRRTDSNSSSTSTVTAGNNTSSETNVTEDSPSKRERAEGDHDMNMDGLIFDNHRRPQNTQQQQQQQQHQQQQQQQRPYHRRDYSAASTASTLSVGGFSLSSYEPPRGIAEDAIMSDTAMGTSSPKRQKKNERSSLVVDTGMRPPSSLSYTMETDQSNRFEQLSIDAKAPSSSSSGSSAGNERNIFLSLSTSPINAQADVDATPISKNTTKREEKKSGVSEIFKPKVKSAMKMESDADRPSDTPTPPVHGELGEREGDDHSMLNKHLRGQSFTPLPHASNGEQSNASPSNSAFASSIAPQLSWSIAGDTPSLGDLAEWEEDHTKLKQESKSRPSSTTSADTRNMAISPHDFQLWKEEHETSERAISGTTTPLPVFFDQSTSGEGRENQIRYEHNPRKLQHPGEADRPYPMFQSSNAGNPPMKPYSKADQPSVWTKHDQMPDKHPMGLPPTPIYSSSEYREDAFASRSPHHADRRDGMEYYPAYPHPHPGHGPNDRIRNLRGRVPPGAHLPPMPLHIPPPMSSHLPMTSPMGLGPKAGVWSPHNGGMPPPLASPHHLGSPLNSMTQSKRKCVPLKPPIPSKFQGDMEKTKTAQVPEFTSLVNFPSHMSQKQAVNLPEGMRCCVMCGQACPCSAGGKSKKSLNKSGKPAEAGLAPRSSNGQEHIGDKNSGYAIIPTQNKGLCTLCDVNVWVVVSSGLEIKWCKGCKNFRPWAAFGDKGLATKCLRCRERQREKYALQKEEKEKARMVTKVKK